MERPNQGIIEIATRLTTAPVALEFTKRVKEGLITKNENPDTHFCVYFAAYDPLCKELFIGHHIKSDLWLFNGGHMDKGETPTETLTREIGEEWGVEINLQTVGEPKLITITHIIDQTRVKCKKHYDIWYFVPVSKSEFNPDKDKLATEFFDIGWKSIEESRNLVTEPNTLKAISEFERLFRSSP